MFNLSIETKTANYFINSTSNNETSWPSCTKPSTTMKMNIHYLGTSSISAATVIIGSAVFFTLTFQLEFSPSQLRFELCNLWKSMSELSGLLLTWRSPLPDTIVLKQKEYEFCKTGTWAISAVNDCSVWSVKSTLVLNDRNKSNISLDKSSPMINSLECSRAERLNISTGQL